MKRLLASLVTAALAAGLFLTDGVPRIAYAQTPLIEEHRPQTGRVIKEDSTIVNMGDLQEWRPVLNADEVVDDSDKSFTVPANKEWRIVSLWVELTTTVTATVRQIEVQIQDTAADVVLQTVAGATQDVSITRNYLFAPGVADMTAFRDTDKITNPFPDLLVLPAAFVIRVFDNNAVDAAADDMVVQLIVAERDAP